MTFLKKFENSLSEILKDKVKVEVNKNPVDGNEEHIFKNIIKPNRLLIETSQKYLDFSIYTGETNDPFFFCSVTEFPSCCGQAILHGFRLYERYVTKYIDGIPEIVTIDNSTYDKCLACILDLIACTCKYCKYSSYIFIISEKEQLLLYKSIDRLGYKPIDKFSNGRMSSKNVCNLYTIKVELPMSAFFPSNLKFAESI